MRLATTSVLALSITLAPCALAGDHLRLTQEYGFTFSEVGDPGNPAYTYPDPIPGKPPRAVGGVDHRFRIATTEISLTQWGEFVLAYAPFVGDDFSSNSFSGGYEFAGFNAQGVPQYEFSPELLERPGVMGWRYAARYCNWLHNGKPTGPDVQQWVFEQGAYDTSTFTRNPDGSYNDQRERSPGAKFFIPTRDEWVKAVYWDPERNHGEGGWQEYPYGDTVPVPGDPAQGGQTNASLAVFSSVGPFDVGSYPDWTTPWGLLDASGGAAEWLETAPPNILNYRLEKGTSIDMHEDELAAKEYIAWVGGGYTNGPVLNGFRIAAAVPTPGVGIMILAFGLAHASRKARA